MNDNAKNVIFKAENVAINALYWGKLLKFGKCACVKKLTNMMSVHSLEVSLSQVIKVLLPKKEIKNRHVKRHFQYY